MKKVWKQMLGGTLAAVLVSECCLRMSMQRELTGRQDFLHRYCTHPLIMQMQKTVPGTEITGQ